MLFMIYQMLNACDQQILVMERNLILHIHQYIVQHQQLIIKKVNMKKSKVLKKENLSV